MGAKFILKINFLLDCFMPSTSVLRIILIYVIVASQKVGKKYFFLIYTLNGKNRHGIGGGSGFFDCGYLGEWGRNSAMLVDTNLKVNSTRVFLGFMVWMLNSMDPITGTFV